MNDDTPRDPLAALRPARCGGRRVLTFDNARSERYESVFVMHPAGEWDRILIARDDGTIAQALVDAINDATRPSGDRLFEAVRRFITEGADGHGVYEELHAAFYEARDATRPSGDEALRAAALVVASDLAVLIDNPPHHPLAGAEAHIATVRALATPSSAPANCPWCGHPPFDRDRECPAVSHDSTGAPSSAPDVEGLRLALSFAHSMVHSGENCDADAHGTITAALRDSRS